MLANGTEASSYLEHTPYFIRASIVHSSLQPSAHGPRYHRIQTPTGADASAGESIQTPERLKGLDGHTTALAIFAKLSVRVPGIFRLMFTLFESGE